jgi:hypothetical protein
MARTVVSRLETHAGVFEVAIWRYEKAVGRANATP